MALSKFDSSNYLEDNIVLLYYKLYFL